MSDIILISKTGLYETIKCAICKNPNQTERGCDGSCQYDKELHAKIVEAVMGLAEQRPHGEWVPCSERLPEDDRPVLIYAWNVHHVVARYGQFRTEDGGYKNAWVTAGAWFDNTEIRHRVIAWMPLPDPPKGGDS